MRLTLCMLGNFPCFCHLLTLKKIFQRHFRVSTGLESDQDRHSVGPDLVPNWLQRLTADDKSS